MLMATYGSTAYFQSNATSGTNFNINNMERYIEELIEIYRKNTLKSDEELESLKSLLRNVSS